MAIFGGPVPAQCPPFFPIRISGPAPSVIREERCGSPALFQIPRPDDVTTNYVGTGNTSERKVLRGMSAFRRVRISAPPLPVAPPRSSPGGRRPPPARFSGFRNFPLELLGNSLPLFRARGFPPFEFLGPSPPNLRGGAEVSHFKRPLLQISPLMTGRGGLRARGGCVPSDGELETKNL